MMRAEFKMGTTRGLQDNFALFGLAWAKSLASFVKQQCDGVIKQLCHQWIAIYAPMFAEETKAFMVRNRCKLNAVVAGSNTPS